MKRTLRLLSLLIATLLLVAACTTAEEAGETPTPDEAPPVASPTPDLAEPSPSPLETEPSPDVTDTETPPQTGAGGDQTIFDLAQDNPQLSQLVAAIEAAGLRDELEQAGPITVFAPSNEAFASMTQSDLTALLADPQSLGSILQFHVVQGTYTTGDLTDGESLTTMAGGDLQISGQGNDLTVNGAQIVQSDLQAGNGVVHIIDRVLQP